MASAVMGSSAQGELFVPGGTLRDRLRQHPADIAGLQLRRAVHALLHPVEPVPQRAGIQLAQLLQRAVAPGAAGRYGPRLLESRGEGHSCWRLLQRQAGLGRRKPAGKTAGHFHQNFGKRRAVHLDIVQFADRLLQAL